MTTLKKSPSRKPIKRNPTRIARAVKKATKKKKPIKRRPTKITRK